MTQWVKILATETDGPSLISGAHMGEGDTNRITGEVLYPFIGTEAHV